MIRRTTPLPTTVLAGFLGSGKTTLVNHLLRHSSGQRILVLVNDFGALPIDEDLILSEDGATVTLANGCACCSMGGDLFEAFIKVLDFDPPPDQLLIEASGVAEPRRIANFAKAEPDLTLNAIVTLVDADNFLDTLHDQRIEAILQEQVSSADILLLNKCDLVSPEKLQATEEALLNLNASAASINTQNAEIPPDFLFGFEPSSDKSIGTETARLHSDHEDLFDRWSYCSETPINCDALRKIVSSLPSSILRFKGVFQAAEKDEHFRVIHKVGTRIDISVFQGDCSAPFSSRFVAIGLKDPNISGILDPLFTRLDHSLTAENA